MTINKKIQDDSVKQMNGAVRKNGTNIGTMYVSMFQSDFPYNADPRHVLASYLRSDPPKGSNWNTLAEPNINDFEVLRFNRSQTSITSNVRWWAHSGPIDFRIERDLKIQGHIINVHISIPMYGRSYEDYNDSVFTVPNTIQNLSESLFAGNVVANSPKMSIFDTSTKIASKAFTDAWQCVVDRNAQRQAHHMGSVSYDKISIVKPSDYSFDIYDWGCYYNKKWASTVIYSSMLPFILSQFPTTNDSQLDLRKRIEEDLLSETVMNFLNAHGVNPPEKLQLLEWQNSKMEFCITHTDKKHQSNVQTNLLIKYEDFFNCIQ